jgi:hypothetical protein
VQQERPELVTDPVGAVGRPPDRLGVEVGHGEQSLVGFLVDDRPGDPVVRIAELDKAEHLDGAWPAACSLPARPDPAGPQQEVGRVGLAP